MIIIKFEDKIKSIKLNKDLIKNKITSKIVVVVESGGTDGFILFIQ
jgi:hypothetical protein